jgi:ATP-dependent RNA helicase DDX24/MAK5
VYLGTDVAVRWSGAGFLELEELDEADFGIVGGVVEDFGTGEDKVGKERGKKKQQKRKRKRGGDDQGPSGDDDQVLSGDVDGYLVVVEGEQGKGEKAEKTKKKKKRNRKKRKVRGEVKNEDVADDNAEGNYAC